jgi:hypothetical protein
VTKLRAGRSGFRTHARPRDFSLFQTVYKGPRAYSASYSIGTVVLSPGTKRPEHDDLSHISSVEVKTERSFTSTPPPRVHGVDKVTLLLFFTAEFSHNYQKLSDDDENCTIITHIAVQSAKILICNRQSHLWRQVRSLSQSEVSTQCGLVLLLSVSSIISFP